MFRCLQKLVLMPEKQPVIARALALTCRIQKPGVEVVSIVTLCRLAVLALLVSRLLAPVQWGRITTILVHCNMRNGHLHH